MSATDEELGYIDSVGMDHVTYVLLLFRYGAYLDYNRSSVSHLLQCSISHVCSREHADTVNPP